MQTSIIGIDPGIIHTGCVAFLFNERDKELDVHYAVINGTEPVEVRAWIEDQVKPGAIYIEDYNPGNYQREDKKMSEALGRLKAEFPPADSPYIVKYVDNAGINTLIPVAVQKLYGIHKFNVATHHNDLNSAGKIALLGMLQDKSGNDFRGLVSWLVQADLAGRPWTVTVHD